MEAANKAGNRPATLSVSRSASALLLAIEISLLIAALLIEGPAPGGIAVNTWFAVTATLGAVIVRRAGSRIGWLIQVGVLVAAVAQVAQAQARAGVAGGDTGVVVDGLGWLSQWLPIVGAIPFVFVFLLFPDGRLPSPRWRVAAVAAVAGPVIGSVAVAFTPGPLPGIPRLDNPLGIAGEGALLEAVETTGFLLLTFAALSAVVSLVIRMRGSTGDERAQLKWLLFAAALLLATGFFAMVAEGAINELSFIALLVGLFAVPIALTVALTKYRLYEIDVVVNRTLVYTVLTAAVVVLYILLVGLMGSLLQSRVGLMPALIATGVVAVVFQPLRRASQNAVDRMMFGQRRDPYGALNDLAEKLESTFDPGEVLPAIVETVSRSLKLSFVAIEVLDEGRSETAASIGEPADAVESIPLVYQREEVGRLVISSRRGDSLTATDRRLLADLARNAGPAVRSVALTDALRRSRNELLATREEERRRLRRDLHDGLGPELAGIALGLGAVLNLSRDGDPQTTELLTKIRSQADMATRSIRGLVEGLRPPALDDLGLVGAIREKGSGIAGRAGMDFDLQEPPDLPELPAAVEVAALRIALEAVTNAVRHSQGRRCVVRLSVGDDLVLEVADDGRGLSPEAGGGVGLVSMRERAAEVGGNVYYENRTEGGTTVRAVLPLR